MKIIFLISVEMRNAHYNNDYYVQMWTRFPPYLVGILLGYLLHHTKNKKVVINKVNTQYFFHYYDRIKINSLIRLQLISNF